jgi:hypothetical protein
VSPESGQSAERAINRLAEALGGWTALAAAATVTVTASGWRRHPSWGGPRSTQVAEFADTVVRDVRRPRYRLTMCATTRLAPTELRFTETGDGDAGWVDGVDLMFASQPVHTAIPAWRVAARQRHLDLTSPLRLLRKLMAPDADVTHGEGTHAGRTWTVLMLREPGRPPVRIYLDESGLPVRVETAEEYPPIGDALVATTFGDYRRVGALLLPHRVIIAVNGVVVHDEIRTLTEVGAQDFDTTFDHEIPGGDAEQPPFVHRSTEWVMDYLYSGVRFYSDVEVASAGPVELADGVKIVLGPSRHTLVVEMPDHVVAVEAPRHDDRTHASLAQVAEAFPDKKLRTVIATHPGVAASVTLPTADGGALEIHRVRDDQDDMLIAYLSKPRIVFQSDLWHPGHTQPATRLYDAIVELGLDVTTVVGGHRDGAALTPAAPLSYLRTAAGR